MKPCAVCGQPATGRCHRDGCDETVHSKCIAAHTARCVAAWAQRRPKPAKPRRAVWPEVPSPGGDDEQFAEALALPVAEHDAVLDLLGGDWPEAWPADDLRLAGLRLGDQFRAAEARRR